MALRRKAITSAINGAEYLALERWSGEKGVTIPAYIRAKCGFEPWGSRGSEMQNRPRPARRQVMALDRMSTTIMVTEDEWHALRERAREAEGLVPGGDIVLGLGLPQFLRTLCGFRVRWTSKPNTYERDVEESDAIELLQSLGLDPKDYFPEGYFG